MTDEIPQLNELLYTMKLRNGDEVLFTLVSEEEDGLIIEAPIKVWVIGGYHDDGRYSDLVTQKWLLFADDNTIFISFADIITYTKMGESFYKIYLNAVNRYIDSIEESKDPTFVVPESNTIQ